MELANKELHVVSRRVAKDTIAIRLENMEVTGDLHLKHIVVSTNNGPLRGADYRAVMSDHEEPEFQRLRFWM